MYGVFVLLKTSNLTNIYVKLTQLQRYSLYAVNMAYI